MWVVVTAKGKLPEGPDQNKQTLIPLCLPSPTMSLESPTECEWEAMSWEEQNIWMDSIFNFSSTPQRPQASNISRGTRNVTPAIATEKKWDKSPRFYASGSSSLSYLTPVRSPAT